jgi:signal transduction histidine kinase
VLIVTDDGVGFEDADLDRGMGLANMRVRAAVLGGDLTVTSQLGQGTRVEFRLPGLPSS